MAYLSDAMIKKDRIPFGILNLDHWDLFVICELGFGIFDHSIKKCPAWKSHSNHPPYFAL
jgi:hypothetical protein